MQGTTFRATLYTAHKGLKFLAHSPMSGSFDKAQAECSYTYLAGFDKKNACKSQLKLKYTQSSGSQGPK